MRKRITKMDTTRILIVDDHAVARKGLRLALSMEAGIEVVAEAASGWDAILLVRAVSPDVVLLDLEMPEMDGLETTRRIKAVNPGIRVVILTVHPAAKHRESALQAGADEFLEKSACLDEIIRAIQPNDEKEDQNEQPL